MLLSLWLLSVLMPCVVCCVFWVVGIVFDGGVACCVSFVGGSSCWSWCSACV